MHVSVYLTIFGILLPNADGACSLPSQWTGDWYDSLYGQLTFSGTSIAGWQVTSYSSTISSWTCVSEDTTNNYLLFLGDQKVDLFSTQQNMFRCIKWKKITDNSFYYYARSDNEVNANNARVKVESYNPSVTSWSTSSYCNPSSGPGPEEYHVLIKKGSESLTKQWCPISLLGTFRYVHVDGATESCGTDSEMTVCPSWTTIQYDYNKCTKPQAFSQEGSVFCVNTVTNGDTFYTALYNPGVVDNNLYHRFTCYTISELSSGFYVSDSPGICEAGQIPSTKATDGSGILTLNRTYSCHGQCDFPSTWDGLWYDSGMGNITLNKDMHSVSLGWTFQVHGTLMKSWTCQSQLNATDTMLFKSDQFVEISSTKYNVFRCIKYTRLTDYSYMYYVLNDVEANAGSQRVLVEIYNPSVNSWDPATYCNPTNGPGQEEYHIMVKAGYTNEVKQWCPVPLLGKFTYQHNDGSSVTCSSSSDLKVCPDWTTMTFNYSLCATTQAFSQEGVVHCVNTVTVGSTYYVTVQNPGPVDDTLYHRFTCFAVSSSGSSVLMSDSAGSCQAGQASTIKQSDGSGTLTLTSYESCHGSCSLPSDWNGAWLDTEKDNISFELANNRITSGWSISAFNNTVSAWTCHNDNATQNYLLFKADNLIDVSGTKYNVFRCIKWKKLSSDSYRYYIIEDVNADAKDDRVRIELYDPTVTTWSIETYCSPNASPGLEEYNVIVRQGKEDEVKQWCPIPMLGTFTYSHNDGTTVSCAGNSLLNVCDAWKTMIYDYSKCSTVQAFSSEGIIHCIDTVKMGSVYYTTVINPGSVDNVATKRFACYSFSMSGNQIYMSDSAGGCDKDQVPTVKQTSGSGTLTLTKQTTCYGTSCSLPSDFVSDWYDSGKGNFSFVNSSVIGWDLTAYNDQVSSWTCQDNRDGLYLFKGDNFLDTSTGYKNALICIEVKKLTPYSYQYYVKADKESNANNMRVYVETHNSSVMAWNTSDYCSSSPGIEEYHVIVRKGYENSVKQWCPIPLLGTFTYDHNDGATSTCSGNSGLSVCPNWTTMKFDYTKCSTVQAFSSEGTVDCIHSTTDGNIFYTTVLNPGVVDDTTFYRFTCYAISASGSSVYLSDSRGMCEAGQASNVKQADGSGTLILTSTDICYGSCSLPIDWDGKWYDSGNGNISIDNATSSISSGWSLTVLGKSLNSWTCLTSNSTANLLLFRANSFVEVSGVRQNVFKCIRWERITDNSYIYHIMADKLASGDRLHVESYNSSVTSWSTETYCNPVSSPDTREFHTLVKEGQEAEVKQWCPEPLRGTFSYTHNDGSSVTCSASSDLSVCPEWTTMTFDYSRCSTIQAFSQEGKVSCVYSTMIGSTYFTSVLNPGVVDSLAYNRFTCFAISESGGQVVISDSAGSCPEGMSSSTKASTGSGILTLTLKDSCFGTCQFPSTWDSEWYDSDNQEIRFNYTKRKIESGWTVTVHGSTITSWSCQSNSSETSSLLFLADQQVEVSGIKYNVFKCIRYERVADFSYKYYIYNDREPSAGNLRLTLSKHESLVNSFNMSALCNPSSPPSNEEFHMIVKKGNEDDVAQWCPTSLIGAFSYKHNSGSVVTCNTASNLEVCTNWTTLAFDYTKCPTIQVFSAEGKGECIYTLSYGSVLYVSVLNKGTVDFTSYQRFTCLAVEDTGSILRVSDSAGSCNAGQTPTVKQPDGSGTLEMSLKQSCYGNCSLPSNWDSSWLDSGHGQLIFNQSEGRIVSGWSVTAYGTTLSSWTCHASNSSSSLDSGLSLFKADKTVPYNGKNYNVFRCIEWTKITNDSFYYYVKQDENVQTNNERFLLEEHNPFVTSWDLDTYCNPTTPPPLEEYHVLVKEGRESEVKQWCPVPLRARFNYTHNDGSAPTCGGGSSLSLCPEWSIMTFDYSICSTEQAFSKEGVVYCVNSVYDGTEFHTTVINPGNVSQPNHRRFSCYTIKQEGSLIYLSDSAGSCNKGQDAKTKQNDGSGTITLSLNGSCYGACSFPPLWDGDWYDSLHGDVTFDSTLSKVTGWVYNAYNQPVTPFTCVSENIANNQLLFLGDQQINVFSNAFNVFVCIQWKKITDYSYLFYVIEDVEPNISGNRRAKVEINDPSKTTFSTVDYCKATVNPGVEEYHILIKKGFETSVVQWCPTPLLGRFTYVHNDGSIASCAASSDLQVCPSWTRMTFDYTKCATKQAFSNEGVVDCVQTIQKDGTYFTTVFNNGSVDNTNYYRFSCLAVTVSGSTVYISDSKGSCQANQTSTSKQNDGSGTLVLTKQESCYGNCTFPSTWDSDWYDSSTGDVTMSNSSKAITLGWSVTAYAVPVTTWTCVAENASNNIMLFKGDQVVEVSPGVKKNVFRCIQWKKITEESYFYYIKHDINTNANNMRVGIGSYDPYVVSFDTSTYCSPTSSPGLEEYHMLVKQGSGSEIQQWCPNAFLGKFSYTHDTGSLQTCASSSELSTCLDWRTMTFDYTKCSTIQAFSAEGKLHCVNTVQSGSTYYTSVFNPGTVDGATYHRFTCFAFNVSSSDIRVSDSKGSCQMNQSPTNKATDGSGTIVFAQNQNCYGSCSMPSTWNGRWYDSGLGDIVFNHASHSLDGWTMSVHGQTITSWTCQTENNANNLLLFKADQLVEVNGVKKNVFRCIKWTNITDNSFYYYVYNDIESNAANQRVKIEDHDPSVQSWNISDYCNPISAPVIEEYHVIVAEGQESSVKQWCPIPLLGNFTYTHNDGSATSCASSSGLSVCPTWNTLTFDYTKCATEQIFSKEGVGYCVQTVTKGTTFFTTILNPGDVTATGHHRFTCLAISVSGNQVQISDSAGSCEAGQTATVKASDGSGLLTLTSVASCYGNCTFPLDWSSAWYDSRTRSVEFLNGQKRVSSGWSMEISNNTVSSWTCMSEDASNQLLLLKSDNVLEINGTKLNAFVCIDWKKITTNSYRYYIKNDENSDANNERVTLENHDPMDVDWDINNYCNPSNGPSMEQFHMIVKQGQETAVKQWCPNPLLGTFYYTADNGTSQTCGNGSHVDVCATWTTMTFDYTKCSLEVFSKEGEVYCLYTVIIGSTFYTSVLNPGFVDNTNYHRFTCLAITIDANSDNVYISESSGSCERGQQSTVLQPDGKANYTLTPYSTCHGSCNFPIQWESVWHDSDDGSLEIQAPSKSISPGWSVTAYTKLVTSWTCHAEDSSQNLLLFKSDQTVENAGIQYNLFKCIKWREITPYSHYYYVQADVNSNANNERIFIEPYDPSVTSWNTSVYCNPTSPPKLEEYHVMVKKGFEAQATQPCPPSLIGQFTYTHNDGSAQTCSSSSSLAVCPSWNTMTFDYTKCSTEQAFSKEGIVKCLMFLGSGSTVFTSVLNPGDVTDSRYSVFTCYALERTNDTIHMSDNRGSCAPGQTPEVKQIAGSGTLIMEYRDSCLDQPPGSSVGLCSLPSNWDGEWYHSGKSDVLISQRTKSITSGWDVSISTITLTSWSCVTSNDTGSYLLFKSDQMVDHNGTFYIALRCIQWTKITDYSYMYYPMTDRESLASNARIKLEVYDPAKLTWDTSDYCSPTDPPETEKFHMLVKKGKESQVKQWCPSPLLARFTYKHLTANGTETCTGVSSLDVCTNRTTMTFDYTKCSTTQAFSSEGILYCVKTVVANGAYYTMVLNPGTVDNTFYYRFTCLATTKSGNVVYTSDRPSKCAQNQSSIAVAQGGSGTLEMTPEETCDFTTKVDESKPADGVATGSVIGAVVGILLILLIGVIVGCIVYKYIKRKKTVHNDTERKKPISDDDTPRALHLNVDDMKKNFALPPLNHASPSMSRVSPMIQKPDIPPPSHLPPVPLNTSTPAKQKKKKKHKKERKEKHVEGSHFDQSNGSVPKPDVISGTSAIELEDDYDEAIEDILTTVDIE